MTENEEIRRAAESNEAITARDLLAPYILTRDGIPAGRELMNQPEIRIYIAGTTADYQTIPEVLRNDIDRMWAMGLQTDVVDMPIDRQRIQDVMSNALRYWYTGRIVFTDNPDEANIYVAAYDEPTTNIIRGEAVAVASDERALSGEEIDLSYSGNTYSDRGVVMLSADLLLQREFYGGPTTYQDVLDTAIHEVGHVFGVIHPDERRIHSMVETGFREDSIVSQRTPEQRLQHDLDISYIIRGR